VTFRADFEHRDALIGAALDEFSEHGYDAASLNRVLAAAGMSKGQLYHHFANKEALYLALVEWTIDEKVRWHSDGRPLRVPDDFFDVIEANITASIGFAQARPEVERFARSLLAERGRPIFDTVTTQVGFDTNDSIGTLVAHHHAAVPSGPACRSASSPTSSCSSSTTSPSCSISTAPPTSSRR